MIRSFKFLLALLLALPTAAHARPLKDADPALWVVKDRDTAIYLFGTIHVLKPGLSWFDEAVKTAFDKSDTLVTEIVLDDTAKPETQSVLMKLGLDLSGPPLPEKLPADKRESYVKAVAGLGTPAAAFDRMQPWLAATQLTLLTAVKAGYDPNLGPDHVLTEAAKTAGKPVRGLETIEQQLGYLASLSPRAQLTLLTATVDEVPKIEQKLGAMIGYWSTAKTDDLAKLMNEDEGTTPELAKALLNDRNARWADWIAERMKRPGTVFVAVGAGHLAGEHSVQAFLAKRRIKARRIRY